MTEPDPRDDTSADYEQFEKALLAQDRDAAGVDTADIDDMTARSLVLETERWAALCDRLRQMGRRLAARTTWLALGLVTLVTGLVIALKQTE